MTPPRAKLVDVETLVPHEFNRRGMTEERFDDLRKSIREDPDYLWIRPVYALVDGRIIGGRFRWEAAKAEGWTKIPTIVDDADEETAIGRMLRDNVPYGFDDEAAIAEALYRLRELEADLDLTGLPSGDVESILSRYGPAAEESPPGEFPDADPHVDYRCPGCGFGWSGSPRPSSADEYSIRG